jgi:hypothetical protein
MDGSHRRHRIARASPHPLAVDDCRSESSLETVPWDTPGKRVQNFVITLLSRMRNAYLTVLLLQWPALDAGWRNRFHQLSAGGNLAALHRIDSRSALPYKHRLEFYPRVLEFRREAHLSTQQDRPQAPAWFS